MLDTMTSKKKQPAKETDTPRDRHRSRLMARLTPQIHAAVKELAKKNARPMSWELWRLIILALKQEGAWPGEGDAGAG